MLTIAFGGATSIFLANYLGLQKGWFSSSKVANDTFMAIIGIFASIIPGMTGFGMGMFMTSLGRLALSIAYNFDMVQEVPVPK